MQIISRPRRNRKSAGIRDLLTETSLSTNDLIMPLFFLEGSKKKIEIMTNYSSRNEFSETELKDETVKLTQSLTYYLNDELMKNQRNNAKITRVSNL